MAPPAALAYKMMTQVMKANAPSTENARRLLFVKMAPVSPANKMECVKGSSSVGRWISEGQTTMNFLSLSWRRLTPSAAHYSDGLVFSVGSMIEMNVDGERLLDLPAFADGLIVFDELARTQRGESSRYLIFTCACGIADDGGWEGVEIAFKDERVSWNFQREDRSFHWNFSTAHYLTTVKRLIETADHHDAIEPTEVVFPESWPDLPKPRRAN